MGIPAEKWQCVGEVSFQDGKPVFPVAPTSSGVYRLTFANGYVYIGQAGRRPLGKRFRDYCAPTQGTEQEHVINSILLEAGGAKVEVLTELPAGTTLRGLETLARAHAISQDLAVLNKGGRGYGHYLRHKVTYHEKSVHKAQAELEQWERDNS